MDRRMVGGYTYGSMEATKIGLNFGNLLQRLRRRRVLEGGIGLRRTTVGWIRFDVLHITVTTQAFIVSTRDLLAQYSQARHLKATSERTNR